MELNDQDIELIERYLLGQMPEEELPNFKARLQKDTDFANEVALYKSILSGIHIHGKQVLKNKLKDIETELDQNNGYDDYKVSKLKVKKNYGKLWLFLIIVLIAAALSVYYYMNGEHSEFNIPSPEPTGNEIPVPEPADTSCGAEIFTDSLGEMDTLWDMDSEKESTVSETKEEITIITADSLIMEDN